VHEYFLEPAMTEVLRDTLNRQFDTAWKLAAYHLDGLTTEECLWRPSTRGPHVHRQEDGRWIADWPDNEAYELGPASIAWLTWHLGFWWTMVLDHCFGQGTRTREVVSWPGSADAVREWLASLASEWRIATGKLTDTDLESSVLTRWPFRDRPFADVLAWANMELTKNAAEIGYVRFLRAARRP